MMHINAKWLFSVVNRKNKSVFMRFRKVMMRMMMMMLVTGENIKCRCFDAVVIVVSSVSLSFCFGSHVLTPKTQKMSQ